ncbi:MAG: ferric reductase-like transmembrane domain-containing protein [Candidatus Peregrinibacteria bacterium]
MPSFLLFLRSFLLEGKIPFYPWVQKILLLASLVPWAFLFMFPEEFSELGSACWVLLIGILAVRPLGDIFLDFRILRTLLPLRKEFGILCGSLGIAHAIGFFFVQQIPFPSGIFALEMWDFNTLIPWGLMGFFIAIILVLTSNVLAMKILKRNWKRLHRLVYPFFFVVTIHIAFIQIGRGAEVLSAEVLEGIIPVILLLLLWTLSAFGFTVSVLQKSEK